MRLEIFFEKFDLFLGPPNAVAKMRELVLEWATSGRLCNNSLVDCKEGVLGDVIDLISGQHLLAHEHNEEGRGIPYLTGPSDFGAKNPTPTRWTDQPKVTAQPGDILITVKGSGVGKTNVLADQAMAISRQLMAIRVMGANPEFVHVVLKRAAEHFQNAKTGIAIPGIGRREVLSLKVVLPSLAEQKRIVAKVDELMTLCDQLEAQQQERETRHAALARAALTRFAEAPTPANLNLIFHKSYDIAPADLRKSILTLAVQGKLVPQDPKDEPARELVERISRQKQSMLRAKQIRQGKVSRPETAFKAPMQLPTGWERVSIDTFCFKVTDGTHFTPRYVESGVRFVSAKDIAGGRLTFDRCKFITKEEHEQLYRRCNPGYHDIVISKSGSIGTVALVQDRGEFSLFESLALLKFDQQNLSSEFLVYALTHACASLTAGHIRGVGVKHLHLDILRGLEMALPPLTEQRRIVAKVDQLMALVDQLEAQLAASRTTAAKLLDALVAELTAKA